MVNLVYFQANRLCNVVTNQLKIGMTKPSQQISLVTRIEIIEADDFVTLKHQAIDQVGTDEASTARYQNSHRFLRKIRFYKLILSPKTNGQIRINTFANQRIHEIFKGGSPGRHHFSSRSTAIKAS